MNKRILTICLLLAAAVMFSACGSGGGSSNTNIQHLQINTYSLGTSERVLNLRGPQSVGSQPVTYYIFGSDVALAGGLIPLQPQRKDEQAIGPLAYGATMDNVDLSPWAAYTYIYLRAIPVQPNYIVLLEPGKRFDISTS